MEHTAQLSTTRFACLMKGLTISSVMASAPTTSVARSATVKRAMQASSVKCVRMRSLSTLIVLES